MRIVFLGTGDFGAPALAALLKARHQVSAAISQPDRPAGRGREIRPTPIHAAADALGLRHIQAEDVNAEELGPVWGEAEIGVVAAFGQKIGPAILRRLPRGCINLHGSLLPKYRGAAPIQRAIISGDETSGVTVFQLDERWDTGAIWATRATCIGESETADELHDRLAGLAADLLIDTLAGITAGTLQPQPQDPAQATRAPKLTKAEGVVDWTQPARLVARRINGLWSWPAAAALFRSRSGKQERVLLARAAPADPDAPPTADLPPGAVATDLAVQTGAGRVRILEVKPAGGKRMPFEAFANGRRIAPPDVFLPVEP
ncbi:MAG: methionyl-tRNA formyltransferase [Planctomycetota bacterium]